MFRNTFIASMLASSAVVIAVAAPAHAGERDRAREAIAAADAKIHTAETLGACYGLPLSVERAGGRFFVRACLQDSTPRSSGQD